MNQSFAGLDARPESRWTPTRRPAVTRTGPRGAGYHSNRLESRPDAGRCLRTRRPIPHRRKDLDNTGGNQQPLSVSTGQVRGTKIEEWLTTAVTAGHWCWVVAA